MSRPPKDGRKLHEGVRRDCVLLAGHAGSGVRSARVLLQAVGGSASLSGRTRRETGPGWAGKGRDSMRREIHTVLISVDMCVFIC